MALGTSASVSIAEASNPDQLSRNLISFQSEDNEQLKDRSDMSKIERLLYISHFLSTWNSRLFEFGAFLFLASIYPSSLLPASIYALARAASAAVLSPWIGSFVDDYNRLWVIRISIGKNMLTSALISALLTISSLKPASGLRRFCLASYLQS